MPSRPRPFIDQGRRIAAARDNRGLNEGRPFRQEDLAVEIAKQGYGRIVKQPVISDIERGYIDVPRHMRAPLLSALPGLVLDPLDEEEDVAVQLERLGMAS